jgi:hypothetical protein
LLHAINYVNFKKEDMTCASATSTELTSELMGRTQAKSISSQIKKSNPINNQFVNCGINTILLQWGLATVLLRESCTKRQNNLCKTSSGKGK